LKNKQNLSSFEEAYHECCDSVNEKIKTNKEFSKKIKECINKKYWTKIKINTSENSSITSFNNKQFNGKYKIRKSYFSPTIVYEDKEDRKPSNEVKKELDRIFEEKKKTK